MRMQPIKQENLIDGRSYYIKLRDKNIIIIAVWRKYNRGWISESNHFSYYQAATYWEPIPEMNIDDNVVYENNCRYFIDIIKSNVSCGKEDKLQFIINYSVDNITKLYSLLGNNFDPLNGIIKINDRKIPILFLHPKLVISSDVDVDKFDYLYLTIEKKNDQTYFGRENKILQYHPIDLYIKDNCYYKYKTEEINNNFIIKPGFIYYHINKHSYMHIDFTKDNHNFNKNIVFNIKHYYYNNIGFNMSEIALEAYEVFNIIDWSREPIELSDFMLKQDVLELFKKEKNIFLPDLLKHSIQVDKVKI